METSIPFKVRQAVQSVDSYAEVVFFGSRATDNHNLNSDWDFLILTTKEVTADLKREIRKKIYDIELDIDQVISSVIEHVHAWDLYRNTDFYKNVLKEGILVEEEISE